MTTIEKRIEKICSFYASEYHLEMIMIPYTKGLVTATETESISDEIKMGDKIITGRMGALKSNPNNQMMRGPMGGPRR